MINKAILIGNLGRDPEIRSLDSGSKVANFSIATTETYKDKQGQKQKQTQWHNIVMWSPLAEVVEKYVKKGDRIYIEGKIENRSYEKDGITKYVTEIVARNMQMLGGVSASNEPSKQDDSTGDIPF